MGRKRKLILKSGVSVFSGAPSFTDAQLEELVLNQFYIPTQEKELLPSQPVARDELPSQPVPPIVATKPATSFWLLVVAGLILVNQ